MAAIQGMQIWTRLAVLFTWFDNQRLLRLPRAQWEVFRQRWWYYQDNFWEVQEEVIHIVWRCVNDSPYCWALNPQQQRGHHKNTITRVNTDFLHSQVFIYTVNLLFFFLAWVSKVKECLEHTLSVRVMDRVAGTNAETRRVRNEKWSTAEKRHSSTADLNPSGGQISRNVRTHCGSGGDETPSRLSSEECGPQNLTTVKIVVAQHAVWIVASLSFWQNAEGIFKLSHPSSDGLRLYIQTPWNFHNGERVCFLVAVAAWSIRIVTLNNPSRQHARTRLFHNLLSLCIHCRPVTSSFPGKHVRRQPLSNFITRNTNTEHTENTWRGSRRQGMEIISASVDVTLGLSRRLSALICVKAKETTTSFILSIWWSSGWSGMHVSCQAAEVMKCDTTSEGALGVALKLL